MLELKGPPRRAALHSPPAPPGCFQPCSPRPRRGRGLRGGGQGCCWDEGQHSPALLPLTCKTFLWGLEGLGGFLQHSHEILLHGAA